MKLTIFILIISLMQVTAATFGQKVTLVEKNVTIGKVIREVIKQTGYDVLISDSQFNINKNINANFRNTDFKDVLESIIRGTSLTYIINEKSVTIKEKEKFGSANTIEPFQTIDVKGRVVDQNGDALPGANIKVKGTNNGATSDAKGNFILKDVEYGSTLEVEFVGFSAIEVKALAQIGTIKLSQVNAKLNEVQIIAYGTTSQKFSTSNIATISSEELAKQPVSNLLLSLQGRLPGLFIEQTSGVTASSINVNLQGLNSLQSGTEPFYVIDGVPYSANFTGSTLANLAIGGNSGGSAFNFVNPADIESVSILKDADATAIYGSRAANGAILITTKKGKSGKTKIDLNIQNGWGKVDHKLKLLNTKQYLEMRREGYSNAGEPIPNSSTAPEDSNYDLTIWDQTRYTDWQEVLVGGNAQFTDIRTSLSGGNAQTQFLAGYNFNRQTTVYPNSLADTKGNVHFNVNHKSENNRLKFMLSATYLEDKNQLNNVDLMDAATTLAPNAPALYNADGSLNYEPFPDNPNRFSFGNPLSATLKRYTGNTSNLIGNNIISYEILSGLSLKTSIGYNKLQGNEISITPITVYTPDVPVKTRYASYLNKSIASWIVEPQLTYLKETEFGVFDLLLGSTFQKGKNDILTQDGQGYSSDAQLENLLAASSITVRNFAKTEYKYQAYFGRLNYRLFDKYIVNFTLRRDGTSRFGKDRKFHNFYAIGGAWLFGDESLIKKTFPWLSNGKLRLNYGTTGNDQIPDYQYLSSLNSYSVDIPYQESIGLYPISIANPLLQWEETHKLNFGIDLGFFENRILTTFNLYRNRSSNQLIFSLLPYTTGFGNLQQNFPATIQNQGIEFQLNASIIKSTNFSWSSSVNATANRNSLVAFKDLESSPFSNLYKIGQPFNVIQGYEYAGVNKETGLYEVFTVDGEKTSSPTIVDRKVMINPNPKWYGGWSNTFQYKSLQLDFLVQYVNQESKNFRFGNLPGADMSNQPNVVFDRWQSDGDGKDIQMFSSNASLIRRSYNAAVRSNANYSDASYLRLKNVSLSYSLPESILRYVSVGNARIYAQGQNLLTLTNFVGSDPETKGLGSLPPLRTITFGLQFNL